MKLKSEERKARQAWKASVIGSFRRYKSRSNTIQGIYSQNTFVWVSQIHNHINISSGCWQKHEWRWYIRFCRFFPLWVCPLFSLRMFLSLHSPFSVFFPSDAGFSCSNIPSSHMAICLYFSPVFCAIWSSGNKRESLWYLFSSVRSRRAAVSHTTVLVLPLWKGLLPL